MLQVLAALFLSIGPLILYFTLALLSRRFLFDDEPSAAGGSEQQKSAADAGDPSGRQQICTSPGCVRCNRNKKELSSASSRFNKAASYKQKAQTYGRIERALEIALDSNAKLFFQINQLTEKAIWSREDLPEEFGKKLTLLEQNHRIIMEECEKALQFGYLWTRNEEPQNGSNWFTYSLINQGAWQELQCLECPLLTSLLHQLDSGPLLTDCLFGNAFLSMLPANSAIAEHCGLTNCRLRIHFGLEVPTEQGEKCFMQVGKEQFHWTAASAVIIDDSMPHSVSSMGCPQDRIVLILDFWHPELSEKEKDCLRHIFPAIFN